MPSGQETERVYPYNPQSLQEAELGQPESNMFGTEIEETSDVEG